MLLSSRWRGCATSESERADRNTCVELEQLGFNKFSIFNSSRHNVCLMSVVQQPLKQKLALLCEFSAGNPVAVQNPFSIISIESKMASIEPFFIPPLSPVKSIRISFCISTCRSQYLLPSAIVFQSGEYCIFSHFVCVLLHKLYF